VIMMLFAEHSDTAYSLILALSDGILGPATGLFPTVRIRDGATSDSYLDFDDATFKTSGWVQIDAVLSEIGGGHYEYALNIAGITDIVSRSSVVAEYHLSGVFDQSEVIVLQQLTQTSLTLTVNDSGGIAGLTTTVRIRDAPTTNRFLDWDDLIFKTSGWVLLNAPLIDIGRGHYHRVLDYASLNPTTDTVSAEYSIDNGISVVASERIRPLHAVSAPSADITPPVITNISPAPNGLGVHQPVSFELSDETDLRYGALLVSFDHTGDEVVHTGVRYGRDYAGTITEVGGDPRHLLFSFIRKRGWPAGDRARFIVVAFDSSGNRVEVPV
jgi:hypothetical protein